MITKEKIRIFKKYDGDGDAWLRGAWPWNRRKMNGEDWGLIAQLIQDIKLVEKGLASESYANNLENTLKENCKDAETINELRRVSKLL
ncbi:MAG: hypothetical protein E6H07_00855 [Bacteroidetes bacterium]|nr:MAG: hypothetical protein E6H07_00855 [Bacteroidota bacterium]